MQRQYARNAFGLFSLLLLAVAVAGGSVCGQVPSQEAVEQYRTEEDVYYRADKPSDDYMHERCRLDIYFPTQVKGFATIVWFHGGGLTGGNRAIPEALKNRGFAVVAANYRLSPRVKAPAYIEDAAAAVAWVFRNVERHGGSPSKIFVSGHSAGGYLTNMIGLDKRWLAAHGIDANQIAGLIPYSGQSITHYTIRNERGIAKTTPVIDDLAPVFHVRSDAPPLLIISGDRNLELLGRYEETAYFWRMMKEVGSTTTEILELQGFDHGEMAEPAHPLLVRFVERRSKELQ